MRGRRVAILRALVRPNLILHCDRELFLVWSGSVFALGFRFGVMDGSVAVIGAAIVALVVGIAWLAWQTKKDPQFKDIWRRTAPRYAPVYAARPRYDHPERRTRR